VAKAKHRFAFLDARPLVKASRIRLGPLDARGVPAILLGVAAIVAASGASRSLYKAAAILPESLREARELWLAVRSHPEMLPQQR
jgi:hypothetical protein